MRDVEPEMMGGENMKWEEFWIEIAQLLVFAFVITIMAMVALLIGVRLCGVILG